MTTDPQTAPVTGTARVKRGMAEMLKGGVIMDVVTPEQAKIAEDAGAVALVGIDKNRVFALGWGLGAALVGLAGAIMAIFFYIYPDVGASFALIAYVTVALGGFGSVFGAFAGGIIVGLVEATTAMILPPSLKSVGIYAVYLLVVFVRPRGLFGSM